MPQFGTANSADVKVVRAAAWSQPVAAALSQADLPAGRYMSRVSSRDERQLMSVGTMFRALISFLFSIIFGGVFFGAGWFAWQAQSPEDGDIIVEGVIVDLRELPSDDGSSTYRAVVDYIDPASGTTHRAVDAVGRHPAPTIGSARDVAFDPANPAEGKVLGRPYLGGALMGIGVFVLMHSLWHALRGRDRGRGEDGADGWPISDLQPTTNPSIKPGGPIIE